MQKFLVDGQWISLETLKRRKRIVDVEIEEVETKENKPTEKAVLSNKTKRKYTKKTK